MRSSTSRLSLAAIDDNPADLVLISCYLAEITEFEIDVQTFANPDDGLAWIRGHSPDLVLLDYYLGRCSGLDIARDLQEGGIDIPLILLTGRGDEKVAVEALRAGITDYLPKDSLSPDVLSRSFAHALEKRRLRDEVKAHQIELELTIRDLRRRNDEIQSFYHTLSHELRTPLTAAREFVSIVLDGLAGELNGTQRHYLSIARDSCDQMGLYIGDLLDASRIETGKLEIERRPSRLGPIVDRVLSSFAGSADRRAIQLDGRIQPDLPEAMIDEQRIVQVLTNLVNNALKYTDEGGTVEVSVGQSKDSPGFIAVSVSDSGRGIPPDHLDRIFDRLYQVERLDCGSGGGLGIGLYLVRELVQLHEGTTTVESRPGEGSTFTFTVPTSRQQTEGRSEPQEEYAHEENPHH